MVRYHQMRHALMAVGLVQTFRPTPNGVARVRIRVNSNHERRQRGRVHRAGIHRRQGMAPCVEISRAAG